MRNVRLPLPLRQQRVLPHDHALGLGQGRVQGKGGLGDEQVVACAKGAGNDDSGDEYGSRPSLLMHDDSVW